MNWVRQALTSPETRRALESETRKRSARAQAIFTRLAKHYKSTKHPINLVGMCAVVAHAMRASRVPRLLDEEHLEALASECGAIITDFCHRFLDSMHVVMPPVKMHGFVIGLLYLMRTGVQMWDSIEVLPRVQELRVCLPLESQLQSLLKLSTKIVTESENTIKLSFRSHTRASLVDMGFVQH